MKSIGILRGWRALTACSLIGARALIGGQAQAATITMSSAEPQGSDWTTGSYWSNGSPASSGNTYEVLPTGRLRSPNNISPAIFPGATLQVDGDGIWENNPTSPVAIGEIRFKNATPGTVVITNLLMNGGQFDFCAAGLTLSGNMTVLRNTPMYADSGNDIGGQIAAWLAGAGSIEYHGYNSNFQSAYVNPLNISGPTNSYTGTWNVVSGVLLGTGANALGTNTITVGANGALETTYNINNPNGSLVLNGRFYLHQNDMFGSVTVGGVPLTSGTYTFAALNSAYPANFPASWTKQTGSSFSSGSGSLTVGGGMPTSTSVSSSANPATYGSAVTFTATVAGGAAPTGNVTFYDGTTVLGVGALNEASQAILTTNLVAGSHSIQAIYAGDQTNSASGSAVLPQSVTPASLAVANLLALNKVYDGTTSATIDAANAALVGVLNSDNVTLNAANAVAVFADPNVGSNKTVTVSGLALGGSAAANYVLPLPVYLTASILPIPQSAISIVDQFDNNTAALYANLQWGAAVPVITWDAAQNAITSLGYNNAGSGSAKWVVAWPTTGDQIEVSRPFNGGAVLNLNIYTNVSFDIMFAANSATDGNGSYGAIEVDAIPANASYPSYALGHHTSAAANGNGWIHVNLPFATSSTLSAVTGIGVKIQQIKTGANLSGTTAFWIDNIIFNSQPPPIIALTSAQVWQRLEFQINNVPTVSNPFDPNVIKVDGTFTLPSGRTVVVPAFCYQGYTRSLSGGSEHDTAIGTPQWRLRFVPPEAGVCSLSLAILTNSQSYGTPMVAGFTVVSNGPPARFGYASLAATNLFFQTGDGQGLPLNGENVCWWDSGTYDYDSWFGSMQSAGENFARVWMSPKAFGIEVAPGTLVNYAQQPAWQLDYVLQLAEQKGIYVQLCLDYHGMFEVTPDVWGGNNYWPQNPYNITNGGPCVSQEAFFTNATARWIIKSACAIWWRATATARTCWPGSFSTRSTTSSNISPSATWRHGTG